MAGRGGNVGHYIFIITYVCMYICYGESGGVVLLCAFILKPLEPQLRHTSEKIWRPASVWRRVKVRCT